MSFPQMYAIAYGVHQNYLKNNILSGAAMQGAATMLIRSVKVTQTPTVGKTNLQTIFTPGIDYSLGPETFYYVTASGTGGSTTTVISDTVTLLPRTQNNHSIIAGASVADKYFDMYTGANFANSATVNILALQWNLHVTGLGILKKLK
jgi:hypothetical protein